jgi:hypothetical protein
MVTKFVAGVLGLASCVAIGVASAAEPSHPTVLSLAQMDSVTAAGGNANGYDKGKGLKLGLYKSNLAVQTNVVFIENDGAMVINGGIHQQNISVQIVK